MQYPHPYVRSPHLRCPRRCWDAIVFRSQLAKPFYQKIEIRDKRCASEKLYKYTTKFDESWFHKSLEKVAWFCRWKTIKQYLQIDPDWLSNAKKSLLVKTFVQSWPTSSQRNSDNQSFACISVERVIANASPISWVPNLCIVFKLSYDVTSSVPRIEKNSSWWWILYAYLSQLIV